MISQSGEHLLSLINDILEVVKIEAGRVVSTATTFDLFAFVRDVELMFRMPAEEKKLRLTIRKSEGLPRYVVTDESKLRQILINLLGHALKFTEEGEIILRILQAQTALSAGAPGRRHPHAPISLVFEVEDTGEGIAEEEIKHLFRQFEQTQSGIQSKGGTGLGLAISKNYSVLLGGDLTVSSQVGRGSVFRVTIPVQEGQRQNHQTVSVRGDLGARGNTYQTSPDSN